MSHTRIKTQYNVTGSYGDTEKRTLYADFNLSVDIVSFYDDDGSFLFSVEDTEENNLLDAINRLFNFNADNHEDIEVMNIEDRDKCKI